MPGLMILIALLAGPMAGCGSTPSSQAPPSPPASGQSLSLRGIYYDGGLKQAALEIGVIQPNSPTPATFKVTHTTRGQSPRTRDFKGKAIWRPRANLIEFASGGSAFVLCYDAASGRYANFTGKHIAAPLVMMRGEQGEGLMKQAAQWEKPSRGGILNLPDIRLRSGPTDKQKQWAQSITNPRGSLVSDVQIAYRLAEQSFAEAFGSPLTEMYAKEVRRLKNNYGTWWSQGKTYLAIQKYNYVFLFLNGLGAKQLIRTHTMETLIAWSEQSPGRLASFSPDIDSFVEMDRLAWTAARAEILFEPADRPGIVSKINDRKKALADPALISLANQLVAASGDGRVALASLGSWRTDHATIVESASIQAVGQARRVIDLEIGRRLPIELEPAIQAVGQLGEGISALYEGYALYRSVSETSRGLDGYPAYRSWLNQLAKTRQTHLQQAWPTIEKRIGSASSNALEQGVPAQWVGVPGDTQSPVYRKIVAAYKERKVELFAEKIAPIVGLAIVWVELEAEARRNRIASDKAAGRCPDCRGHGLIETKDSRQCNDCDLFGNMHGTNWPCPNISCSGGWIITRKSRDCGTCDHGEYPPLRR